MAQQRRLKSNRRAVFATAGILVAAASACFMINVSAEPIETGRELALDSVYSYEIVARYDGVDVNGVASDDTRISAVQSGHIELTHRVANGLTFEKFNDSAEKIRAIARYDGTSFCEGNVSDLKYDEETRIVSANIDNLQAGCDITIGVTVRTPSLLDDETTSAAEMRRNFHNYATLTEAGLPTVRSNLAHSFIGEDFVPQYRVSYEYTGEIPEGAPALPDSMQFTAGERVELADLPQLFGYKFSGWVSGSIDEGATEFIMPASDVTLSGIFMRDTDTSYHKLSYRVDGAIPDGYVVPSIRTIAAGEIVKLDTLTKNYAADTHGFSGWMAAGIEINDSVFVMPDRDVEIIGSFHRIQPGLNKQADMTKEKFSVVYQLNLPDGCQCPVEAPLRKSYAAGETVHISNTEPNCAGYGFKGWQIVDGDNIKYINADYFRMPNRDLELRAVWAKLSVEIK